MFGEEHDLCLRAAALGYRPAITPDAEIVHLLGASTPRRAERLVQLLQAKATIVRDHWRGPRRVAGLALLWLWAASRRLATGAVLRGRSESTDRWRSVWAARRQWLAGY
jgi:GT2 family glycosyltransferase